MPGSPLPKPEAVIDTAWFLARLKEIGLSQSALARQIGMDRSALHLMLHGKRKMYIDEAMSLAASLRIPVETVIAKATGIPESVLRGPQATPSATS